MFLHSCTIFNSISEEETHAQNYASCKLQGVLWQSVSGAKQIKTGMESARETTVYIPFTVKADKRYLPPQDYARNPAGKWTLQAGDRLVKGLVDFEITGEAGHSIADLEEQFEVAIITMVETIDYGGDMMHWEVNCS